MTSKKILVTLLIGFTATLFLTIFHLGRAFAAAPDLPVSTRSFAMGLVPIPIQPLNTKNWLATFDILADNADYVMSHSPVDAPVGGKNFLQENDKSESAPLESLNFSARMAKKSGLKLFLVIDPLSHDRETMDPNLLASMGKNFGAAKVRQTFKNYALRVVKDYQPDILSLGSEINTYLLKHPKDEANFFTLIQETVKLLKTQAPHLIITLSFQYESLQGLTGSNQGWKIFKKFEPELDMVAITTYPSPWFETPDQIPADYYAELKKHTRKPVIIAESGWPSGGAKNYHGSKENQRDFLDRIVTLTRDLDLKLWIWWFLHDWRGEGYPGFFKTMGLRESNGKEKPAWRTWEEIYRLPNIKSLF
jgi:hypothetical protein